jgi:uncharacterized protein YjbI with pentapeptide repeats
VAAIEIRHKNSGSLITILHLSAHRDEPINLEGADLRGAACNHIVFHQLFRGGNFEGANLEGAILVGLDLTDALFQKANLRGANLRGATLRCSNNAFIFNLRYADLTGADLRSADLSRAELTKAILADADLSNATLDHVIAPGADCQRASFRSADLSWATFHIAPKGSVRSNFCGADLTGAIFNQHNGPSGALYDKHTRFPVGFKPKLYKMKKVGGWFW